LVGVAVVPQLLLGSLGSDFLLVEPGRYERPEADDFWDGNWVRANVTVVAGAFRGSYAADLRADEFEQFHRELAELYRALIGEARYKALEPWLDIRVVGDGLGHLKATCELRDDSSFGARLWFELTFDQTELKLRLADLAELVRLFPVRGRPG
jgi:hypothetical protein